ncbi:MAG: methylglyoxal synthase [Firmicutes bacterium]|nr:methylglyoxal synthase [Bacillota bacterium]
MRIALIAHDRLKEQLVTFVVAYQDIFQRHTLYATGTTGLRVTEATGLPVHRFQPGPLGGDQQIGALIAANAIDLVLFFRDPLMAQPHEPDINALLRLCDVHNIPVATNIATAEVLIRGIQHGLMRWHSSSPQPPLPTEGG